MSRLEHFQQIIKQAKIAADKSRLANLPAADWWEETRTKTIKPVLVDAESALTRAGFEAEQVIINGSGIMLRARCADTATNRCITFKLSEEVIIVSCTDRDLNENWDDRGYVTEEKVIEKIDRFLELFVNPAGSGAAPRSSELKL